jgi:hypothetical protein
LDHSHYRIAVSTSQNNTRLIEALYTIAAESRQASPRSDFQAVGSKRDAS